DPLVTGVQTCALPIFDELVLELVVGHANDAQVPVEVGRLDVQEAADADHPPEVAGRQAAELAAVPAEVGRALEAHLAEPEPVERSEERRGGKGDRPRW